MNNLEAEIKEYLMDNNLNNKSVSQIADEFFVSRAYVYKIINKLGFNSYRELNIMKQYENSKIYERKHQGEFENLADVDNLINKIRNTKLVLIVGLGLSKISAEYFSNQLLNIGIAAIWFQDIKLYQSYMGAISVDTLTIVVSSTGIIEPELKRVIVGLKSIYVITVYKSELYNSCSKSIGVRSNVNSLSNKFNRENQIDIILALQRILLQINSLDTG